MSSRVVEAEPARSKPLAGVSMRISTGERHGFGASARWWTRASSFHFARAKRPADFLSPKLVRFVGSDDPKSLIWGGVLITHASILPSRRDVSAEPKATVHRDADCSCS